MRIFFQFLITKSTSRFSPRLFSLLLTKLNKTLRDFSSLIENSIVKTFEMPFSGMKFSKNKIKLYSHWEFHKLHLRIIWNKRHLLYDNLPDFASLKFFSRIFKPCFFSSINPVFSWNENNFLVSFLVSKAGNSNCLFFRYTFF